MRSTGYSAALPSMEFKASRTMLLRIVALIQLGVLARAGYNPAGPAQAGCTAANIGCECPSLYSSVAKAQDH